MIINNHAFVSYNDTYVYLDGYFCKYIYVHTKVRTYACFLLLCKPEICTTICVIQAHSQDFSNEVQIVVNPEAESRVHRDCQLLISIVVNHVHLLSFKLNIINNRYGTFMIRYISSKCREYFCRFSLHLY